MTIAELEDWVRSKSLPSWRSAQITKWIYGRGAQGFDAMTDLPFTLREMLSREAEISAPEIVRREASQVDETVKLLLRAADDEFVECVYMTSGNRRTFCISSQVGCAVGCPFCQTGELGFRANLDASQIVDQVLTLQKELPDGGRSFNVVFMGMGEPFLNLGNVKRALAILHHPQGFGLGWRRITVSTAGYPRAIDKLASSGLRPALALSLNATTDTLRSRLMPGVAQFSIRETLAALRRYAQQGKRRATLEYVLLAGVNDSKEDAGRLSRWARFGPFKVNLIPYNPGTMERFRPPSDEEIDRFARWLRPAVPALTVRRSRGPISRRRAGSCADL